MKFSITRLFNITSILATNSGKELKAFIETLSQLQDQVLRLSQNNVTIDDNMKMKRVSLTIKDATNLYTIKGDNFGPPSLVLLNTSTAAIDNPLIFNWKYDGRESQISLYIKGTTPLKRPETVEILVFYK